MQLSRDELELIFDFCMGVATSVQLEQGRDLIAGNTEAAQFYSTVQKSLEPLNSWQIESCPDDLVEKTIERVNEQSDESQQRLEKLITEHGTKRVKESSTIWIGFARRFAVAATFIIVGIAGITGLRYIKFKAWQIQCQNQLARISQGLNNYISDNEGKLPAVATVAGDPWWKVGDQGKKNVSNTRHVWLLPKGQYVNPDDFICPGVKKVPIRPIDIEEVGRLNDFPNRQHIGFSFRLICNQPKNISDFEKRIMISDLNPLFENLPANSSPSLRLKLNEHLQKINSNNHRRKGQNVMYSGGQVQFLKSRKTETNDDIFTIGRDIKVYEGVETPTCDSDVFLAP